MEKPKRKVTIEVLMEAPGGNLVFQPIEASPNDMRKLIEATNNPVIKHSIENAAKEKKVKI